MLVIKTILFSKLKNNRRNIHSKFHLTDITFISCAIIFLFLSTPSSAGLFGYDDFDECILGSMKGVKSDTAASAIYSSCRKKFPKKKVEKKNCETLDSRNSEAPDVRFTNFGFVSAYNPHENKSISEIIIGFACGIDLKRGMKPFNEGFKKYKIPISVDPLTRNSTTAVSMDDLCPSGSRKGPAFFVVEWIVCEK